jgi:hypothetical protein
VLHCCIRHSLSESILGGPKRLPVFSLPTMVETPVLFFLLTFVGMLEGADIAINDWVKLLVKRQGSEDVGCGCDLTRMCEFKLQPGGELAKKNRVTHKKKQPSGEGTAVVPVWQLYSRKVSQDVAKNRCHE